MAIFLGGRKGDREIILGVVIEHIFKYITKKFAGKYYKMATLEQFSRRMLNLRQSAANLKLEKRKKICVIYMSVASELRRGF